jgi:uncharacterized membrane protein
MQEKGQKEPFLDRIIKRRWDIYVGTFVAILGFLIITLITISLTYFFGLFGGKDILTDKIDLFWPIFAILLFIILLAYLSLIVVSKKRDLENRKQKLEETYATLETTLQDEYNTKNTNLDEEYEKKVKELDDTHITDYPGIVKNFETFVMNYYITIVENSKGSLYYVTYLIYGNIKKKENRFEKDVGTFVDNYQNYQNKLEFLSEKPKKLERKKFEKYVGKFKKVIKSSDCIFEHFNDYWDEFKVLNKDNPETIDYRIDDYNKFYENYRLLQIENKQISNQLNSLNIRINFIIPKAKLPDKL